MTRSKKPKTKDPSPKPDPDLPYWLPTDHRWKALPEELRQAIPRILTPAYRRFVLEAAGEMERSMGLTLVHLMWLELCGHCQLAVAAANPESIHAILQNPDDLIDRHLRLVATKCQTAELLTKIRLLDEMLARQLPSPSGRGAGGEGSQLPPPFGTAAGGDSLPSPFGRGAGGEGLVLQCGDGRREKGEG